MESPFFYIYLQILQPASALLVVDVQNDFLEGSLALRNCPAGQQVCQYLAVGLWFSPDTLVSFTNKTDHRI
jgi:nicotinamidase-related amidase